MCLLTLFFRVVEDAAVIAGANREEFYHRGGEAPCLLDGPIPAVAGIDPVAGGTWFGINANGVLVAVTNRRKLDVPTQPRSRGLLVREMLACPSAAAALDHCLAALGQNHYAGANFLCADAGRAVVIQAGEWLRVKPLPPGIHVLANRDVNDVSDPRMTYVRDWLNRRLYVRSADCVRALAQLCAQHEPDAPPICFRENDRGTVSSSIVALRGTLTDSTYLHAQGPPCQTAYANYSHLLHQLKAKGEYQAAQHG